MQKGYGPRGGRKSPSGRATCPGTGPLDASIVLIGESPSSREIKDQLPFTGQSGRILDKCLRASGAGSRADVRVVYAVPAVPPGGEYERHSPADELWGLGVLQQELDKLVAPRRGRRVLVPLGEHALRAVYGLRGLQRWRGSIFPPAADVAAFAPENRYWEMLQRSSGLGLELPPDVAVMPTYDPGAVLKQMPWHLWMIHDLGRAVSWADGRDYPLVDRAWFRDDPGALHRLVAGRPEVVAIDTEMSGIVSLVTADESHIFQFGPAYRPALTTLMADPEVMKVAHNMAHDWRQFEKWWGIPVSEPYYDTICLAHIMEPSGMAAGDRDKSAGEQQVGKSLSPHLSTRFTAWPYHKWLRTVDEALYCGIDSVVCYDAYVQQIAQATQDQKDLAAFDIRLWRILFDMQRRGIRVDLGGRDEVIQTLQQECATAAASYVEAVTPAVRKSLRRFRKPHLFFKQKQCECCNGGKTTRGRCWKCAGYEKKPNKAEMVLRFPKLHALKKAELEERLLRPCRECEGLGKIDHWLDIEPSRKSQVGDMLYRGFRVPVRRFEGKETVRIEQLERMLEPGQYLGVDLVEQHPWRAEPREALLLYRSWVRASISLATAERITPGDDGRVRCTFDPWYTPTSRVASREGLLDEGTNLQNIPKEARRLLIPSEGHFFVYPDYRQVEGRSMAVITGDPALLAEYAKPDADSHQLVADMVGITRDQAKMTFFATCYGVEAPHLAAMLGLSEREALDIINRILRTFSGVRRWRTRVDQQLRETRGIRTRTGWFRRWLGHVVETRGSRKGEIKKKVTKEALATEPQYMGARVLAQGLIQCDELMPWILPVAHIHDASLVEVPLDRAAEAIRALEQNMAVREWGMDFPVDACCGPDWYAASTDDRHKAAAGYGGWEREALLANGAPVDG